MRLKVLIPVATDMWNKEVRALCEEVASPDTSLSVSNITKGPVSMECEYDEAIAAPYVLQELKKAEDEGYDAAVIYCFANPALYAAKELLRIPVVGIGEAAMAVALAIGERIGIIGTVEHGVSRNRRRALTVGVAKITHVRALSIPVLQLGNKEMVKERAVVIAREMVNEDGVDCIILGCGSILGVSEAIEQELGVPVVVPGKAGIVMAEGLARMGLAQSKRSFLPPPKKERIF